jgi:hypothetical protein
MCVGFQMLNHTYFQTVNKKKVFGFNPHQLGFEIESNQTKTSNFKRNIEKTEIKRHNDGDDQTAVNKQPSHHHLHQTIQKSHHFHEPDPTRQRISERKGLCDEPTARIKG